MKPTNDDTPATDTNPAKPPRRRPGPAKPKGNGKDTAAVHSNPRPDPDGVLASLIQSTVAATLKQIPRGAYLDEIQPKTPMIHHAVMNIMADVAPIAKKHVHDDEGFNFRLIDEMTAAVQPLMIAHSVYPSARVISHEHFDRRTRTGNLMVSTVIKVGYRLVCAHDGSMTEEDITMGESLSDSSYSTNAAQTMALKQFIWQKFFIPVLNADDAEAQATPDLAATEVVSPGPRTERQETAFEQPDLFSAPSREQQAEGKTRRRGKKDQEQTEVPATASRRVDEAFVSKGSLRLIRAHMHSKPGVTEALLLEHFKIASMEELKQGQLNDVKDFIDTYTPEGAGS